MSETQDKASSKPDADPPSRPSQKQRQKRDEHREARSCVASSVRRAWVTAGAIGFVGVLGHMLYEKRKPARSAAWCKRH